MSRAGRLAALAAAAWLLLWPAVLNGFPLLFADSGTYASQVAEHVLGWDRPPFYGLLVATLGWQVSLWPVVAAQAVAAAAGLALLLAASGDGVASWRLPVLAALLAGTTALPWCASEIMPDAAAGLVVLAVAVPASGVLTRRAGYVAAIAATGLILLHLSYLPIGLAAAVAAASVARPGWRVLAVSAAPVAVAAALILGVNLAGHGRASLAPFGPVFMLARLIEDGPARAVLARGCPPAAGMLCAAPGRWPGTADAVLWAADSPLRDAERRAVTPGALADEAGAVVRATWRAAPWAVAAAMARDFARQLASFATGDGLHPWPAEVAPQLARTYPPAERAAYARARQTRGALAVPGWLAALHRAAALAGVAACAGLALWRGAARPARALAVAALVSLVVNAAVTGALSGPHDRYQARLMWLPLAVAAAAGLTARGRRRAGAAGLAGGRDAGGQELGTARACAAGA